MTSVIYKKEEELLRCEHVDLSFGNKKVLSDISFTVRNIVRPGMQQGQVISLIGRSGMGKSQLLRILAGLRKPDAGAVIVGGSKPVQPGLMGVIFQQYYLFRWRTVRQCLMMALEGQDLSDAQKKERVHSLCAGFGMEEVLDKFPGQLSGGQRQRACIIQQLLHGSDFLLMDEPFSGLDVCVLEKVMEMLMAVSTVNELKTIIIVSHDIETSLALSDTAFVLACRGACEGAGIVREIDLIERGLAWRHDVRDDPAFRETVQEVKRAM